MPKPIKRRELIRRMRLFGWEGEYQEGKHPFMVKSGVRVTIRIHIAVISTGRS